MTETPPIILTIAGFDPSSGAGVTADLKTIAAHGCYGVACITALTVQSTRGVRRVHPIKEELVTETLQELAADLELTAVHIGMLGSKAVLRAVGAFLTEHQFASVVLDPVLRSSSGAELLEDTGAKLLVEKLLPLSAVITPNLDEASALSGLPVKSVEEMRAAARRFHQLGAKAIVITGGHLERPVDVLSLMDGNGVTQLEFPGERQETRSTHGTGCAFSSALACQLANGKSLIESVPLAKAYVEAAIANAYPLGGGVNPVNHLYRFDQKR